MRATWALGSFLALGSAIAVGAVAAPDRLAAVTGWVKDRASEQSATVEGRVFLGGRPVPHARIVLVGTQGEHTTTTSPDGSYRFEEVPVGSYQVSISAPEVPSPSAPQDEELTAALHPPAVPVRYHDAATSGVQIEVQTGTQRRLINLKD